jgi:hypothetical protein
LDRRVLVVEDDKIDQKMAETGKRAGAVDGC